MKNCNFLNIRNCCGKFLCFAAVCPDCKFYTPAEVHLPKTTSEACLRLFHILQPEILKVHMGAMQMSALLQPPFKQYHTELIAVEPPLCTIRSQNLSPTIQAQRLLRAQYLKSDTRWWASSLQSWAVQCVCCNLQLNEVHSAQCSLYQLQPRKLWRFGVTNSNSEDTLS